MGLQDLIVTARHQFGGHGLALGFSALLFVGVVFFPSLPLVGVVLFPIPTHFWNLIRECIRRGRYASEGKLLSLVFSIIPPSPVFSLSPPFLFLLLLPFLFLIFFLFLLLLLLLFLLFFLFLLLLFLLFLFLMVFSLTGCWPM